jgi:hypothetical protein
VRFALAESEEAFVRCTDGRTWNGWEMPRFERGEAERLIRRLIRWLGDGRVRFDVAWDAFVTVWVLSVGTHATVVKPKALAERVRRAGEELVCRYAGS